MTLTTTDYNHYGNQGIREDIPYFYVAYNVVGSSVQTYTSKGGGDVRNGVLADAKADLMRQFPLGPNQAYVNYSVDQILTKYGYGSNGVMATLNKIVVRVVVSADVIEYGTIPSDFHAQHVLNYPFYGRPSVTIDSSRTVSEKGTMPPSLHSNNDLDTRYISTAQSDTRAPNRAFYVGEFIRFTENGKEYQGEILKINPTSDGTPYYFVSFLNEKGRRRWVTVNQSQIVSQ